MGIFFFFFVIDFVPVKPQVLNKTAGKRIFDKEHCCYFCQRMVKHKMNDHLAKMHASEPDVAEILKLPLKQRREGYRKLTSLGNFKHNVVVLESGEGKLLAVKRPSNTDGVEFLPCPVCYGFYQRKELWKHHRRCSGRLKEKETSTKDEKERSLRTVLADSRCILGAAMKSTNRLAKEKLLPTMRKRDAAFEALSKDSLILEFGSVLYKKLGKERKHDVQQRMRQLGRLVVSSGMELTDLLKPQNFEAVIAAIEKECGGSVDDDDRACYTSPGTALRMGRSLERCAKAKIGVALREGNDEARKEGEAFLELMKYEWSDRVSSVALNSLKSKAFHNPLFLRLTQDIQLLVAYQEKQMEHLMAQTASISVWTQLSELCMTRMMLLNKQRGEAVARLTVRDYVYEERQQLEDSMNKQIEKGLSGVEKQLLKR